MGQKNPHRWHTVAFVKLNWLYHFTVLQDKQKTLCAKERCANVVGSLVITYEKLIQEVRKHPK